MKIRKKLDEYGMVILDELDFKFYGGGGKGGGGKTKNIYMPAPAAVSQPVPQPVAAPAPTPVTEAVTQDTASTPEEEAKKLKEANKSGAKSLQIPLTGSTSTSTASDATKAVGTV